MRMWHRLAIVATWNSQYFLDLFDSKWPIVTWHPVSTAPEKWREMQKGNKENGTTGNKVKKHGYVAKEAKRGHCKDE